MAKAEPKVKKPVDNQISDQGFLKALDKLSGKEKVLADKLKAEMIKKQKK